MLILVVIADISYALMSLPRISQQGASQNTNITEELRKLQKENLIQIMETIIESQQTPKNLMNLPFSLFVVALHDI